MERGRTDPKWLEQFGYPVESTLGGLCGLASERIIKLARRAGFSGVRFGESRSVGHTFVRWTQGRREWIIDVTATQFNNRRPRVCMFLVTKDMRLPFYWQED